MLGLVISCLILHYSAASSHSNSNSSEYHNFDFSGRDFLNTQTNKLCILARLNVSIQFNYTNGQNTTSESLFIPPDADKSKSFCDYHFVSLLRLDFGGVSFRLNFTRDKVINLPTSPIEYCDGCDTGNWWLASIRVIVNDTTSFIPHVPHTTLKAVVNRSDLVSVDGGFSTGVSLKRGYLCKHSKLVRDLDVEEAKSENQSTVEMWKIRVNFHLVGVQPFLVTNNIIKDPLLCKDFTVFLVLIILLPILYFVFFIAFYRLKHKYGLPSFLSKKKLSTLGGVKKPVGSKKQLLSTKTSSSASKVDKSGKYTSSVTVTYTAPDTEGSRVLINDVEEAHASNKQS